MSIKMKYNGNIQLHLLGEIIRQGFNFPILHLLL